MREEFSTRAVTSEVVNIAGDLPDPRIVQVALEVSAVTERPVIVKA
jgi:hypothetical protein